MDICNQHIHFVQHCLEQDAAHRLIWQRWLQGEEWQFSAGELKVTEGLMSANQLLLRMPTVMVHAIDDDSPLADWRTGRAAVAADSDSEIVIVVSFQQVPGGFV